MARPRRLGRRDACVPRDVRHRPADHARARGARIRFARGLGRVRAAADGLGHCDAAEHVRAGAGAAGHRSRRAAVAASTSPRARLVRARAHPRAGAAAAGDHGERAAEPARYLAQPSTQRGLSLRSRLLPRRCAAGGALLHRRRALQHAARELHGRTAAAGFPGERDDRFQHRAAARRRAAARAHHDARRCRAAALAGAGARPTAGDPAQSRLRSALSLLGL